MKYRQIRKRDTGQWVDVLFTVDGDAFSVPEESHRTSIATALGLPPDTLETVEGSVDARVGVLIPQPPVLRPGPTPDDELVAAITAATTLAGLKAALVEQRVKVKARDI